MELDDLRYFLKVAEMESVTHAAEELGVSQSTLSRAIQRLECELQRPLFERKTRSLALTEAGQLLRSRASQVLALLDDTKMEIMDDGRHGRLRVGAIPTIAPYYLPEALQEFSVRYPDVMVVIQELTTDALLKKCKEGEIDVGIASLPLSERYLEIETLFEEELLLAVAADHPLAKRRKIEAREVQSHPFILLDEVHCLSDQVISFCQQQSFQPVVVERTSQLTMVQELVALGHGVSLIPEMARQRDRSKRRVYRSIVPRATRTIVAVWNPYRFESRIQRAFLDMLQRRTP